MQVESSAEDIEARYRRIASRLTEGSKWTVESRLKYQRMYDRFIDRRRNDQTAASTSTSTV